jgi:hypothetical protein
LLGEIAGVEIIAVGSRIRDLRRLRRVYGRWRWRKLKGTAVVRLPHGTVAKAEHGYETRDVGRKRIQVKRILTWL